MRRESSSDTLTTPESTARSDRLREIIEAQRTYFGSATTRPIQFRREQLLRLKQALLQNEGALRDALQADLHKSPAESYLTEVFLVVNEINYALRNLRRWTRRERVKTDIVQQPARSYRVAEPLGVVLIIAPWNYPVQLSLLPLVGAIAAGNCAVIKPSELAPNSSSAIARLIADTFPSEYVTVVEGGPDAAQSLLELRFDYIFFTGGTRIGRHILRAAAEHLTPVTLELGGKSPCIVDRSADIAAAAKRIGFSRFINAGQTCVSPDYVLVQSSVKDRFVDALVKRLTEWWGDGSKPPEDFSCIVDGRHFERLASLIRKASEEGATIVYGGAAKRDERYIAPTVITGVKSDSALMEEEIFGPILPVIEYNTEDEAIGKILERPSPLAAYLFSSDRSFQERFVDNVPAGGMCLNDCLSHMTTTSLPFGGVGESGMGSYHGLETFRTFSHHKSVMKKARRFDLPVRYPPYERREGLIRLVRRLFT